MNFWSFDMNFFFWKLIIKSFNVTARDVFGNFPKHFLTKLLVKLND